MYDYGICPHCCEEELVSYYDGQLEDFMLYCPNCGYYCDMPNE